MLSVPHVASFRTGDHICLFYRNADERAATLVPFVQVGLLLNERCVCILPPDEALGLKEALAQGGIRVEAAERKGSLRLITPEESYLRGGEFSASAMVELLRGEVLQALASGFHGFRAAGDLAWAVRAPGCYPELAEYESTLAEFVPALPARGLCMYDLRLFGPEQMDELMRLHRLAVSHPSPSTCSIRLRRHDGFGDVVFAHDHPHRFSYTVRKDHSSAHVSAGHALNLTAALRAIETSLAKS
ncbi:MAG TPA: MEDS domain-containing protein [Terriglobales bacterium]|nr:MEDS domain-containing protein [Terriglobales bacterium]